MIEIPPKPRPGQEVWADEVGEAFVFGINVHFPTIFTSIFGMVILVWLPQLSKIHSPSVLTIFVKIGNVSLSHSFAVNGEGIVIVVGKVYFGVVFSKAKVSVYSAFCTKIVKSFVVSFLALSVARIVTT